ncbi:MAG: hypothetical protein KatS3mg115_1472 [Candidatus Poribacteria bacterium]|nr:MAG: hypothetical protein KatS3mg115_1472 [Candidatus Poribacteria bacterium]
MRAQRPRTWWLLLRLRTRIAWNTLRTLSRGRLLLSVLLLALLGAYGVQLTGVFFHLFRAAEDPLAFATANFGMFFLFGIVQAASIAMQRFVTDSDLELLGALPIPPRDLFVFRFWGVNADLLRLGLLSVPFYLGYGLALRLPWGRWALLALGWALVWLLSAALGVLIVLGVIRLVHRRGRAAFFRVTSLLVVVGLFAVLMGYASFVRHEDLRTLVASMQRWSGLLRWAPTTWCARLAVVHSPWQEVLGLVVATALSVEGAALAYVRGFRYEDALVERGGGTARRRRQAAPRPLRPAWWAVFVKETRTALRDPSLLFGWVSPIVLILLVFYFTQSDTAGGPTFYLSQNMVGFFVALRVAFSLISREGETFPWLRVHLRTLRPVIFAKSLFASIFALPLVLLAGLWWSRAPDWRLWVGGLGIAVGYGTFGVGLGGLFPRFQPGGATRSVRLPGFVALYTYFFVATFGLALSEVLKRPWIAAFVLSGMVLVGLWTAARGSRRLAAMEL